MEEVVRSVYLFSTCTDKQMKRLCAALKRTPFPKGKDVMREGDAGDVMCRCCAPTSESAEAEE